MTPENYLKFLQLAVTTNTVIIVVAVINARRGNLKVHRILNGIVVGSTLVAVAGLVVTVLMGWDYSVLTTPRRMLIHRCFSVPLLPLLIGTAYFGATGNRKWHLRFVRVAIPFWLGVLLTGWMFF